MNTTQEILDAITKIEVKAFLAEGLAKEIAFLREAIADLLAGVVYQRLAGCLSEHGKQDGQDEALHLSRDGDDEWYEVTQVQDAVERFVEWLEPGARLRLYYDLSDRDGATVYESALLHYGEFPG